MLNDPQITQIFADYENLRAGKFADYAERMSKYAPVSGKRTKGFNNRS